MTTPHVLLVTFNSQGHVNPFLRLAKRIAAKGLYVTFSSTTEVEYKIRNAAANAAFSPADFIPVGKGFLRFEFFHDGWVVPDKRRLDLIEYMPQLKKVGSLELAALIRCQADQGRPVTSVIGNPFIPWVLDVAETMGIPSAILWVQSAAVFSTYYHYYDNLADFPTAAEPNLPVTLPGMPTLERRDIPSFLLPDSIFPALTKSILAQFENLEKASCVFVNTFQELESELIKAFSPITKLIPVGPLAELPEEMNQSKQVRADLFEAAGDCMDWLDKQKPNSVVYVSVGSIVQMGKEEMVEMAMGLKESKRPFLWVVRDDSRPLLPDGFEEETKEQGMVVKWSPQDRVLTHKSVACFLTHCGWNSTLECLTSGVPVITFPHWGDQPTDAKFLVDVYGVGVHLRPKEMSMEGPLSFTREDLMKAIMEVVEGPKAEEIRRRSEEWKEVAVAAAAEGGSSDMNIQAFVEEMRCITSDGGAGGEEESIVPIGRGAQANVFEAPAAEIEV